MIAVFVNCFAVFVGSVFGLLFAKKFSDELSDMIQTAAGIVTVVLGIQMAFKYDNIIFLTLSLILGGIIGYIIDIDGAILRFGNFLSKVVSKNQKDVPQENLENQNTVVTRVLRDYYDMELGQELQKGTELIMRKERAEYVKSFGHIEIIED